MLDNVAIELEIVAGNPSLTFIFFIALSMLTMLGLRFAYYAYRNRKESDLVGNHRLWDSLALVGLLSVLFSVLGVLEIITTLSLPVGQSLMLAVVLLLSLTMRDLYRSVATADAESRFERPLTVAAAGAVVTVFLGLLVLGRHGVVVAVWAAAPSPWPSPASPSAVAASPRRASRELSSTR